MKPSASGNAVVITTSAEIAAAAEIVTETEIATERGNATVARSPAAAAAAAAAARAHRTTVGTGGAVGAARAPPPDLMVPRWSSSTRTVVAGHALPQDRRPCCSRSRSRSRSRAKPCGRSRSSSDRRHRGAPSHPLRSCGRVKLRSWDTCWRTCRRRCWGKGKEEVSPTGTPRRRK